MPDRELPDHLKQRLSRALDDGAPLGAPLPSQARYARASATAARGPLRSRLVLLAGVSATALVVLAFAGPPQPRAWIVQSVGNIARGVGAPAGPSVSSPTPKDSGEASPSPKSTPRGESPSPEPAETPGASESPEPSRSPEPAESPEPSHSPDSGETHPSPSPEPNGGDGGDAGTPSPSPQPSDGGG